MGPSRKYDRGEKPRLFGEAQIIRTQGRSYRVLKTFKEQVVESLRKLGLRPREGRSLRYADIPCNMVVRCARLEDGSGFIRQGASPAVRLCQCSVEAGISEAWCTALPPLGGERFVSCALVACVNMAEDRREWATRALGRWNASGQSKEGT